MGCLQKTALCLLFLSISSSASNGQFAKFTCSDVIEKEYSENATMSCTSHMTITNVTVGRCENCSEEEPCPDPFINTMAGTYFSQEKRIYLELHGLEVVLHIQKTNVSDQGVYQWFLDSDKGHGYRCTTLKIRAPHLSHLPHLPRLPHLTVNRTELVCQSPIGHQQRQIHWSNGHGTNLTGSAHLVSEEAGDGLTRLTSTLHGDPSLNPFGYCCTVLYDAHTKGNKAKCLSADEAADYLRFLTASAPDTPKISKEHIATILVLLFLVLCSFAAVLYYRYRQRDASRRDLADPIRSLIPILQQFLATHPLHLVTGNVNQSAKPRGQVWTMKKQKKIHPSKKSDM
ncbi:uncharacterized protein [Emydura macquarii macquarii]|uniref:uncharacterized protein n=1 Tax=Emydura macquarii macquarii TaxID=1129001 RepID=UPI003529DE64